MYLKYFIWYSFLLALWAFMYFIAFFYLWSQWSSAPMPPMGIGAGSMKTAIVFCFFNIFSWVSGAKIELRSVPYLSITDWNCRLCVHFWPTNVSWLAPEMSSPRPLRLTPLTWCISRPTATPWTTTTSSTAPHPSDSPNRVVSVTRLHFLLMQTFDNLNSTF